MKNKIIEIFRREFGFSAPEVADEIMKLFSLSRSQSRRIAHQLDERDKAQIAKRLWEEYWLKKDYREVVKYEEYENWLDKRNE